MAGNLGATAENLILDHINGVTPLTITPPMMVGLSDQSVTAGNENGLPLIPGVAKQPVTFGAAVDGVASNTAAILFPDMPATTVTWFGVYDSTDKLIWQGQPATDRTMAAGDAYEIPAGMLVVSLD